MRRNRNETELIAGILTACHESKRISAIIREVGIPHTRLVPLLEHLIAQGLVAREAHSEPVYITTDRGREFLAEYRKFRKLCDIYAIRP